MLLDVMHISFLDSQVSTVGHDIFSPWFRKINRIIKQIECDCDWFSEVLKGASLNFNESKFIVFYGKETKASLNDRTCSESLSSWRPNQEAKIKCLVPSFIILLCT